MSCGVISLSHLTKHVNACTDNYKQSDVGNEICLFMLEK